MNTKHNLSSEEKAQLILSALEDKKAVDPVVIDVHGRTVMTDFLIIATGTSKPHINALADAVIERLADNKIKNKRVESHGQGGWTLLDYGDVVVHVLSPELRQFYRLEAYWSGAEKGSPPLIYTEEA